MKVGIGFDNSVNNGGFTCPGTTCQDEDLALQGFNNGIFLNLIISNTKLIFHLFKTCLDFVLSTNVRLVFHDTS